MLLAGLQRETLKHILIMIKTFICHMRWHHDVKFTNHCNYNASCTRKVHRQEYEKAKHINKAEKNVYLYIYIELYRMVNSVQNAK